MTNFEFIKSEPRFDTFADVAVSAEKIILLDPEACIMNCRRGVDEQTLFMEFNVYK